MSKTLISGTSYDISHGKTLISGTSYTIDHGNTLINGTQFVIELLAHSAGGGNLPVGFPTSNLKIVPIDTISTKPNYDLSQYIGTDDDVPFIFVYEVGVGDISNPMGVEAIVYDGSVLTHNPTENSLLLVEPATISLNLGVLTITGTGTKAERLIDSSNAGWLISSHTDAHALLIYEDQSQS